MPRRTDDWFRSSEWTTQARDLFEHELARSKSDVHKAQYLKIKGLMLTESPDTEAQRAGVDLLWRVDRDYSAQSHEVSHAHKILGDHFARAGNLEGAEARYRHVLTLRVTSPNIQSCAIELAEVLQRRGDIEALEEALDLVDSFVREHKGGHFNIELYRINLLAARVLRRLGPLDQAKQSARRVLELMDTREPQLSRHPTLGLTPQDESVRVEMRELIELP